MHSSFSIFNFAFSILHCRVLAPGAWNLPARATVSFHLTRTAYAENAEMILKRRLPIYSNRCEMPSISHRCAEDINSCSIFNFQFCIFNSSLLPTFTSNFILHPFYFIELTYVMNNRIINKLLSRALLRLFR